MRKVVLFVGLSLFSLSPCFAQQGQQGSQPEEISITTYYPSPYGSYNELQTNKMAVGDTNGDGKLDYSDGPANDGELAVAGNVGIGTRNPQGKLDLRGPLAVNGSVGTSGQVLQSQGSGLPPIWTASGGTVRVVNGSSCPAGYSAALYYYQSKTCQTWPWPLCSTGEGWGSQIPILFFEYNSGMQNATTAYFKPGCFYRVSSGWGGGLTLSLCQADAILRTLCATNNP